MEQCTLTPKKECRDVSVLIPSLVPVDKCLDVPKEVCSKVLVPRKIKRISTRLFCDEKPTPRHEPLGKIQVFLQLRLKVDYFVGMVTSLLNFFSTL